MEDGEAVSGINSNHLRAVVLRDHSRAKPWPSGIDSEAVVLRNHRSLLLKSPFNHNSTLCADNESSDSESEDNVLLDPDYKELPDDGDVDDGDDNDVADDDDDDDDDYETEKDAGPSKKRQKRSADVLVFSKASREDRKTRNDENKSEEMMRDFIRTPSTSDSKSDLKSDFISDPRDVIALLPVDKWFDSAIEFKGHSQWSGSLYAMSLWWEYLMWSYIAKNRRFFHPSPSRRGAQITMDMDTDSVKDRGLLKSYKEFQDPNNVRDWFFVSVVVTAGKWRHANCIVLQRSTDKGYYFEPHGFPPPHTKQRLTQVSALEKWLRKEMAWPTLSIEPMAASVGPQIKETKSRWYKELPFIGIFGKCLLWCAVFFHILLEHPDWEPPYVIQRLCSLTPNVAAPLMQLYSQHVVRLIKTPDAIMEKSAVALGFDLKDISANELLPEVKGQRARTFTHPSKSGPSKAYKGPPVTWFGPSYDALKKDDMIVNLEGHDLTLARWFVSAKQTAVTLRDLLSKLSAEQRGKASITWQLFRYPVDAWLDKPVREMAQYETTVNRRKHPLLYLQLTVSDVKEVKEIKTLSFAIELCGLHRLWKKSFYFEHVAPTDLVLHEKTDSNNNIVELVSNRSSNSPLRLFPLTTWQDVLEWNNGSVASWINPWRWGPENLQFKANLLDSSYRTLTASVLPVSKLWDHIRDMKVVVPPSSVSYSTADRLAETLLNVIMSLEILRRQRKNTIWVQMHAQVNTEHLRNAMKTFIRLAPLLGRFGNDSQENMKHVGESSALVVALTKQQLGSLTPIAERFQWLSQFYQARTNKQTVLVLTGFGWLLRNVRFEDGRRRHDSDFVIRMVTKKTHNASKKNSDELVRTIVEDPDADADEVINKYKAQNPLSNIEVVQLMRKTVANRKRKRL